MFSEPVHVVTDGMLKEFCFGSYIQPLSNSLIHKSFLWFQQVASCEHALIKANRKPIQNHQSKTMFLFKTYTLEFEFNVHLEHMVSYQGIQSGLSLFLVGEFGT